MSDFKQGEIVFCFLGNHIEKRVFVEDNMGRAKLSCIRHFDCSRQYVYVDYKFISHTSKDLVENLISFIEDTLRCINDAGNVATELMHVGDPCFNS